METLIIFIIFAWVMSSDGQELCDLVNERFKL